MFFHSLRWSAFPALLLVGAALLPPSLHGQTAVPADRASSIPPATVASSALFTPTTAAPTTTLRLDLASITSPLQASSLDSDSGMSQPGSSRVNAGSNVALMGTGAAAVVIGLLVGGDGGTIIALGGGVIGLVGLYRYLR